MRGKVQRVKYVRKIDNRKYYDTEMLNRINKFIYARDYSNAHKEIKTYMEIYPNDPVGIATYARLLCFSGEIDEALNVINGVINNDFRNGMIANQVYAIYGEILSDCHRDKEMIEAFRKGIAATPGIKNICFTRLLHYYLYNSMHEEALELANSIPENDEIRIAKAQTYYEMKEYELARKYIYGTRPECCNDKFYVNRYHYVLGGIYNHDGLYQSAIAELKKCDLDLKVCLPLICEELIFAYNKLHLDKEAFEVAKIYAKNNNGGYNYTANYYIKVGDFENARKEIAKMEESFKKEFRKICLEYSLGNIDKALEMLTPLLSQCNGGIEGFIKFYLLCSFRTESKEDFEYKYRFLKDDLPDSNLANILDSYVAQGKDHNPLNYSSSQMYEFDKDLALSHIDRHHGTKTRCYSFFQSDDIGKIYEFIQEQIKNLKPIYNDAFDKYYIHATDIKKSSLFSGDLEDIVVITLPNSTDIVTMYPNNVNYEEYMYSAQHEETKGKKRVKESQIDKFNRRFGNR